MSALRLTVKFATRLLEASIALVVVAYLLLGAALLTLRYAVLPNAQQFVPWLQQVSSRALGLPVQIGSVSSRWHGLLPTLTLRNLVIDDSHGRPALRLAAVQALPSWKSLPRLQLSFEQLAIRGADLRITREDADHLDIGGIRLDLRSTPGGGGRQFADWLFSQDQILIQDSDITWIDKTRDAPPLQLRHVQLDLRNTLLHHRAALLAQAPPVLGGTLQLRADMHQPLFDRHPGDFAAWHGQLWADLPRVDLDELSRWVHLPAQLSGGNGALRGWLQLGRDYQPQSATVVAALGELDARLGPTLPALRLSDLSGRLNWRRLAHGSQIDIAGLRLRDADGTLLAPRRLQWSLQTPPGAAQQGSLSVGDLDLGALDKLAQRLPLPTAWRARLLALQPQGRITSASLRWSGSWGGAQTLPQRYALQAGFSGLGWDSPAARATAPTDSGDPPGAALPLDLPGIRALDGSLSANQDGGNARLRMRDGAVALPTVFEAPSLPVQRLDARLSWSRGGDGRWDVQGSQIQLQTPDATGSANLRYTTQAHGPGLLDLSAQLSHADARAVPLYLPRGIGDPTRDYLRSAIAGGESDDVHFLVQGPLASFPFVQPGSGVFRVDAKIRDGVFNAAPRQLLPKGQQARAADVAANAEWPEFRSIDGNFSFTSRGMSARGVSARVGTASLRGVELDLPDYTKPLLRARGQVLAQADEALRYVRSSPLDGLLGHSLSQARASGPLRLQLDLSLPLQHVAAARVRGQLQLLGDQVDYLPTMPTMDGVRGRVDFSEQGFSMRLDAQRFAGGPLQLSGTRSATAGLHIQASGQASATALRAAPQLRAWRPLLRHLDGSAPFELRVDAGVGQAQPTVQLRSTLQGLAVDLPAPLGKTAATSEALRVTQQAGTDTTRWQLEFGGVLRAQGVQDDSAASGVGWRELGVALGAHAKLPRPAKGVQADVDLPALDIDAWQRALGGAATNAGTDPASNPGNGSADASTGASAPAGSVAKPGALQRGWLPDALSLRTARLTVAGREFDDVVLAATRSGALWQAQLQSRQLGGALSWRMGSGDNPGSVVARLSHLQLPKSADNDVERLLDGHVRSLPAIDLQARDVVIHDHSFDSLQLHADNRGRGEQRVWLLNSVRLSSPDAQLTASGVWSPGSAGPGSPHRMSLGFRLDVADAGALLARLGKPGLLKGGKGLLQGTVSWLGSPLSLDYPTLSGQFNLSLGKGQFLKADLGISKLLGVLSLQSLPRRLMFNFNDVFARGFAFDKVDADVQLQDGIATTNNFKMSGLAATVFIDGSADLAGETQNLYVVVVPDINAGSASLAYALINPAVGLGTFIAQLIAREPLMKALTYGYHVTGSWADPKVEPQSEPHVPRARPEALLP